jgi:hypothetical protein
MNLIGHWHDVLAVQRMALRAAAHSGDPAGQVRAHLPSAAPNPGWAT